MEEPPQTIDVNSEAVNDLFDPYSDNPDYLYNEKVKIFVWENKNWRFLTDGKLKVVRRPASAEKVVMLQEMEVMEKTYPLEFFTFQKDEIFYANFLNSDQKALGTREVAFKWLDHSDNTWPGDQGDSPVQQWDKEYKRVVVQFQTAEHEFSFVKLWRQSGGNIKEKYTRKA